MKHLFILLFLILFSYTSIGQNQISPIQVEMSNVDELISLQTEYASMKFSNINNNEVLYNYIKESKPLYKFEIDKIIEFRDKSNKNAFELLKTHLEIGELFLFANELVTNSTKLKKDVEYIQTAVASTDMKVKINSIESVNKSWIDVITVKERIDDIFKRNKKTKAINELATFFDKSFLLIDQIRLKCFTSKINKETVYNDNVKATKYLEKIDKDLSANQLTIETLLILKSLSTKYFQNYTVLSSSVPKETLMKLY